MEYSIKYDMLHNFNNKVDVISLDGKVSAGFKGNTEISDEIILAELESRSRNVFSADLIKNDVNY